MRNSKYISRRLSGLWDYFGSFKKNKSTNSWTCVIYVIDVCVCVWKRLCLLQRYQVLLMNFYKTFIRSKVQYAFVPFSHVKCWFPQFFSGIRCTIFAFSVCEEYIYVIMRKHDKWAKVNHWMKRTLSILKIGPICAPGAPFVLLALHLSNQNMCQGLN